MFLDAVRAALVGRLRKPRHRQHQIRLNAARRLLFEPLEDRRLLTADFDFGDAPDTYGTLSASGGAKHQLGGSLSLGATVDGEPDGRGLQPLP